MIYNSYPEHSLSDNENFEPGGTYLGDTENPFNSKVEYQFREELELDIDDLEDWDDDGDYAPSRDETITTVETPEETREKYAFYERYPHFLKNVDTWNSRDRALSCFSYDCINTVTGECRFNFLGGKFGDPVNQIEALTIDLINSSDLSLNELLVYCLNKGLVPGEYALTDIEDITRLSEAQIKVVLKGAESKIATNASKFADRFAELNKET